MTILACFVSVYIPHRVGCDFDDCSDYYRWVMSVGLLLPFLLAVVALALLSKDRLNRHLQHHRTPLLGETRVTEEERLQGGWGRKNW